MKSEHPSHVIIIGGGFAGLYAARRLRRANVRITLLDRRNHHLFQPLLYQVAMAGLNPSDVATPIRAIVRKQKNIEVFLADVESIDRARRVVITDAGDFPYDYLIIATGATHSYFGHPEWALDAPGLKTIEDALEIRRRVLLAYEAAERSDDPAERDAFMTFLVIGAGPTGVELAGALAEIAHQSMGRDFRRIDPSRARIILIEGLDRVLPTYPEDLSAKAEKQLRRLGADVMTGARVTAIDKDGVELGGKRIAARTVLWAAGVQGSSLAKSLNVPLERAGRVLIEPTLTVPGDERVFVVGDLAYLEQDGKQIPGVAPAAMQEGAHAAENITRAAAGEPLLPFRYRDKGSLATIGRAAAVADFGKVHMSGAPAWLAWLLIHIFFLIGFRNRILVLLQWGWAYLTFQRGARLITGDTKQLLE